MRRPRPFAGLTAAHEAEFRELGFTVFESILPEPLIERLRAACDTARSLARAAGGPNTQRLQPILDQPEELDQAPFVEYGELPELRQAVADLLSPAHRHGERATFGVLFEPQESSWGTNWHRDFRDNIEGLDMGQWWERFHYDAFFNQVRRHPLPTQSHTHPNVSPPAFRCPPA